MKRIILLSLYVITCIVMTSCTNDEVDSTTKHELTMDGGDPNNPIEPPRPE